MKPTRWESYAAAVLAALAISFVLALITWTSRTLGPSDQALLMLRNDSQVRVTQGSDRIVFEPVDRRPTFGFILYPGAGVDYRSYAPVLRQIAARNHLAVVLRLPLNLAFFAANGADQVIDSYPKITRWVIGGHSLGGVVAASYVVRRPSISGLVLWASYPADDGLRATDARVLSIYGSEDGLTTPEEVLRSQSLLPQDAVFLEIRGGNHSQFGSYGLQSGDNEALISAEEQWGQIAEATAGHVDPRSK